MLPHLLDTFLDNFLKVVKDYSFSIFTFPGDNERDPNVNYAEAAVKIPGIGFADGLEPFTGGGSPDTFNHSRKDPRGQAYKRARHR